MYNPVGPVMSISSARELTVLMPERLKAEDCLKARNLCGMLLEQIVYH